MGNYDLTLSQKWVEYLKSRTNLDVCVHDNPRYVTFTHPGFPRWVFDTRFDFPPLLDVVNICQNCVTMGIQFLSGHSSTRTHGLSDEFLYFQTGIEVKMTRALYQPAVLKWPIKAKVSLINFTGPYVSNQVTIMSEGLNQTLVTLTNGAVHVDPKTRRAATALPKHLADMFNSISTKESGLRIQRLGKRPTKTYCHKALIDLLDLDTNQHANYLSYVGKCYSALIVAVTEKEKLTQHSSLSQREEEASYDGHNFLKWITSDIMGQGVKTLRIRYFKESVYGDEVLVYLWQEDDKPFLVFFSMERETASEPEVLFEMSLEYFSPESRL